MRYITFDDLPDIPQNIAVCPMCAAPLVIEYIEEWETETGRVTETGLHIACQLEPDIDSDEWEEWHRWHYRMPYADWLPVCRKVYAWFDNRFRLTPLQADAARPGEAEQLALPAAQLKHGG